MKKIIMYIGALLLLVIICTFGYFYYQTRPSGDIDKYANYYVSDDKDPEQGQIKVTYFGVTTLLLDDGETQLLIDGFFSRPALLKTLSTEISSDTVLIDQLMRDHGMQRIKAIFVAHSHYDHAFDVAHVTKKSGAILYGSESTLNIARGGQVQEEQLRLFAPGQDVLIGDYAVRVLATIHSPDNALQDDGVTIPEPLAQPAKFDRYHEGGSFDFYIRHGQHKLFIKPSPNYAMGALDSLQADVLMLGIGTVGKRPQEWQDNYYRHTVGALHATTLIPLHWDDFLQPISDHLVMLPRFANDGEKDFDFFIRQANADNIAFSILQGTKSILLF